MKVEADKLFNEMGMNLTTAVNVFVRQAVLERAIPFRINRGTVNTETTGSIEQRWAAMQEIRNLLLSFSVTSVTGEDCRQAIDFPMEDFEDALVVVCAEKAVLKFIRVEGLIPSARSRVRALGRSKNLEVIFNGY